MYQKTSPCSRGVRSYVLSFVLVLFAFHSSFAQNPIVTENMNAGVPNSTWDLITNPDGTFADASINGYADQISVNQGGTINFKVNIDANTGSNRNYTITIYRLGYYGGNG